MPQHKRHGVLGMARITGTAESRVFSIRLLGTEAATEITNCLGVICPRSSATTSSTTCGFTAIRITSASLAACKLFVPTGMPSFALMARARSSCATVAVVSSGARRPFLSNACSRMPPIFPAPSTATLLPERLVFMLVFIECLPPSSAASAAALPDSLINDCVICDCNGFSRASPENPEPLCLTRFLASAALPLPGGLHNLPERTLGFPLQQILRARGIGDENGRIPGPTRRNTTRNFGTGDIFHHGDH